MAGEQRDDVSTIIDRLGADLEDVGNAYDAGLAEQGQAALARAQQAVLEVGRLAKQNGRPTLTVVDKITSNGTPIYDLAAEENILGACFLAPPAIPVASAEVTPEDFYRESHRIIFRTILALAEEQITVDLITVADRIEQQGQIGQITAGSPGGPDGRGRLQELASIVPASSGVGNWAKIVHRCALERRLGDLFTASPRDPEAIGEVASQLTRVRIAGGVQRAYDAPDWLASQPEGTPSIWGRGDEVLWAEGEPLMIYGPDGVGKTSVAQQIVLGLCGIRLEPLLGMPMIRADRPVLYLACDRPRQARRSLYRMLTLEQRQALKGRLLIWQGPLPFAIPLKPKALLEFCLMHEAGYLVIDSLKDVAVQLTDPETALKVNQAFQWLNANNVELLVLHHPRKDPAGQPARAKTLEDVYGDRNFVAGMGSVISLYGKAGDPIVSLEHLKQPAGEVGPLKVLHDHERGESRIYDLATIEEILRLATRPLTVREIATRAYAEPEPSDSSMQKTRNRLKKMEAQGLVQQFLDQETQALAFASR